jgi:hypothetical protein
VIQLAPIGAADTDRVAAFLREQMERPWSLERWRQAIVPPWPEVGPNRGFQLLDGERLVGAYVAYYSERQIGGATERICNLGTWAVHPGHRAEGLRLLRELLRQEGYSFTDLTPNPTVQRINSRLGFEPLGTHAVLVPNFPWPPLPGRGRVSSDPATLERELSGAELRLYRDHAGSAAARHLLLSNGAEHCYVVVRRDIRRHLPVCTLLYAGNPALLSRMTGALARHLLLRQGAVAHVVDGAIADPSYRPRLSLRRERRWRTYRSKTLRPEQIDYLYSELACLP